MNHNYWLRDKRILLRPLEEGDLEELRVLRNKNRFCFNAPEYIAPEQQKVWFEKYLKKSDDLMFTVELVRRPGEFAGAIALYDIHKKSAEFGRTMIDKEKAPEKGIGREAVIRICRFAFEELGVERVTAEVLKTNERAFGTYAKAGCIVVGETEKSWCLEMRQDIMRRES